MSTDQPNKAQENYTREQKEEIKKDFEENFGKISKNCKDPQKGFEKRMEKKIVIILFTTKFIG